MIAREQTSILGFKKKMTVAWGCESVRVEGIEDLEGDISSLGLYIWD
jgi:hypothetical protein